jgi:AhpD family alkylhydroperoxidase
MHGPPSLIVMRFCTQQGLSRIHSFVRPGRTKRNPAALATRAHPITTTNNFQHVSTNRLHTGLACGTKAFGGVYSYVAQSGLDPVMVNLVYLRVSQINGCAYCLDMHTRDLVKQGVTFDKLALVQTWREGGKLFSEREKAALAWAEMVTQVAQTGVPDEDFMAASAVFSAKELVDLTFAIGLMNTYNRLAISFRKPPEATRRAER